MKRKSLIAGGALALTLAALLAVPAWLAAGETQADDDATAAPPSRGFLGVELRALTPELQTHFGAPEGSGVLVASIAGDSPAAAAGVRVGDVITAVDGLAIDSARDLSREVRNRPGQKINLELYRAGTPLRLDAVLGERRAHEWSHGSRTPEEWTEFARRWERWGEEFGQKWGEQFGEKWGEEFGQRWGEEHAEQWQRWAEEMARHGEGWEEMGEEIGRTVEKALAEVDWEQIGRSVEQSMEALEAIDWEAMSEEIESRMEELDRRLEEQRRSDTPSE